MSKGKNDDKSEKTGYNKTVIVLAVLAIVVPVITFALGFFFGENIMYMNHMQGNDYDVRVGKLNSMYFVGETEKFNVFIRNNWKGENTFSFEISSEPEENGFNIAYMCDYNGNKTPCKNYIKMAGFGNQELEITFNITDADNNKKEYVLYALINDIYTDKIIKKEIGKFEIKSKQDS